MTLYNAPFSKGTIAIPIPSPKNTASTGDCNCKSKPSRSLLSVQLDEELSVTRHNGHCNRYDRYSCDHTQEPNESKTISASANGSDGASTASATCSMTSSGSCGSVSSSLSSSLSSSCEDLSSFRRKIFPKYWRNHTPQLPAAPIAALVRDPRSPLLNHYAVAKTGSDGGATSSSTTQATTNDSRGPHSSPDRPAASAARSSFSPRDQHPALSVSPARRSIFGASCRSKADPMESEVKGFLSSHKHMTLLPASFDEGAVLPTLEGRRRSRLRSYSCSEVASQKASSKKVLTSCLRRRHSELGDSDRSSNSSASDDTNKSLRHSVTFDSQVSIVSFEPTTSMECYTDGSWTDVFDH